MMKRWWALAGLLLCAALPPARAANAAANVATNALQVFPFPEAMRYSHHNDDYTVKVRTPGGVRDSFTGLPTFL